MFTDYKAFRRRENQRARGGEKNRKRRCRREKKRPANDFLGVEPRANAAPKIRDIGGGRKGGKKEGKERDIFACVEKFFQRERKKKRGVSTLAPRVGKKKKKGTRGRYANEGAREGKRGGIPAATFEARERIGVSHIPYLRRNSEEGGKRHGRER